MHVLLIEDDELVASGLVSGLEMDAFVVDWVTDARSAENTLATLDTDIVILISGSRTLTASNFCVSGARVVSPCRYWCLRPGMPWKTG